MLPTKETLTIEFKSDRNGLSDKEIVEAAVAFANTDGGSLYLGIEDNGEITGTQKQHADPIGISALIANSTRPPISVRAEIIEASAPVLLVSVPKSYGSIVATTTGKTLRRQIKANGEPENIAMFPSEYATRLSDLRLLDYSALTIQRAGTDDFDPLEVERLKQTILSNNGEKELLELSDNELFKALGFVRDQEGELRPTITGLLLVGKKDSIERYVPTHSASFQVLQGTDVRINEDYKYPILNTIGIINNHFDAWNSTQEIENGLFRMSVPDFSKRAFREAVVNAFSHRDYSKMGRVRVAISDEGLTIANPGGFIEGVSLDNLLTAEPHGRNPLLADALKRIGLAEKTGRGIDRIFEGSLLYGKPLPDYSATTSATVALTIPRSAPDKQIAQLIADEQNKMGRPLSIANLIVLNALKDMPKSSSKQLSEATNLPEATIKTILDNSVEKGIVDVYGSGRGRSYMLSNKAYSTKAAKIGYVRQSDIDEARYIELVIKMAKTNDYIARADVVQLLHVTPSKAYQLLKKLVNQGKLERINSGHYAKYKYIE